MLRTASFHGEDRSGRGDPATDPESARCLQRVAVHGAVGGLIGYAALHPLSMMIHRYFDESVGFSAWDVLKASFSPGHVSMAAYFVLIGAAFGVMYGLYSCRTARLYEEVRKLSITDELTGLCNRRCLMRSLADEIERARKLAGRLSLLMIDVDHFKCYNDTHGHQRGDRLLRLVAGRLRDSTRGTDLVAKYGGEEFVVVMREADRATALARAEKMCAEVASHCFPDAETQPEGRVTVSLGVAEYPTDARDLDGLIGAADAALYKAKGEGRNRVSTNGY